MVIGPVPTQLKLLQKARTLAITFETGEHFLLSCEYLRAFSPSAEVRGHGMGEGELVTGKEHVNILSIQPVGNYAVQLIFDDQHQTGLYSWQTLYALGKNYATNWQRYLERLRAAGIERATA